MTDKANDAKQEKQILHIVCFSGGHSSAISAIETVRRYGKESVILLNHDLCARSEHADIKRFKQDVADYLDLPITYANMDGWEDNDQFDVCMNISAFKYGGQSTALCTSKLKTEPFKKYLSEHFPVDDKEIRQLKTRDDVEIIYGFDANEQTRITRRVGVLATMGYKTDFPLLWENRTIQNTEGIGVPRPITYEIYNHANCIGCLKAGKQHWYCVYCLNPDVWEKAKLAEQGIGYSILKAGYLSELEPEFEKLKRRQYPATEKINPARFWTNARKIIAEDDCLPCECSF